MYFFLPYFKRRTIFSGYGMILKRENNFSDRVNDPVSKGKKVPMLTPMEFGCKMAREEKVKKIRILTIYMCKIHKLVRSIQIC